MIVFGSWCQFMCWNVAGIYIRPISFPRAGIHCRSFLLEGIGRAQDGVFILFFSMAGAECESEIYHANLRRSSTTSDNF